MNVLSIDIDFLFTEMREYHKYINEDIAPDKAWKCIKLIKPELSYMPDKKSFKFLMDLLSSKCKNSVKTFLIQEHDEIIKVLRDNNLKEVSMYNIDYHHDLTYTASIEDLNISNWVVHGRHQNLIKDYAWIKQDDSDMCQYRPFKYKQDSWKDINVDLLPEFDYVIFCVSKHYTPYQHWGMAKKLKAILDNRIRNRFTESDAPIFNISDFPEFDGTDIDCEVETCWYAYNGFYVQSEKINDVTWLSFINIDNKKLNVITPCYHLLNDIISKGKVGFSWVNGYKSEVLINRLLRKYVILSEEVKGNRTEIILKKEDIKKWEDVAE